jgi:kynurenine formamidase
MKKPLLYGGVFPGTSAAFHDLIAYLMEKEIQLIGIDYAGLRRGGKEHVPADRLGADHGVFVIENLCGLKEILRRGGRFLPIHIL